MMNQTRHLKVLDLRLSGKSLKKAGDILGVTPERIRQMEAKILEHIKFIYRLEDKQK